MTRLPVPYLTQLDPVTGSGGANCGPAGLSEMLCYRGLFASTPGTVKFVADVVRDGLFDGIGETGGYTSFAMLFRACAWFSVDALWIDSWQGVHDSLEAGEPVLLLLDNTYLRPRQYDRSPAFNGNHFLLLCGEDAWPDSADVNDPLRTYPPVGPGTYTWDSLFRAIAPFGGVQAMALVPVEETPIVPNQDGIISELNSQILALRAEIEGLHGVTTELQRQVDALHEEVSTRTGERDTVQGLVAPLEARLAQMDAQLREAVALAGRITAQRPTRVDLVYVDGSLGYVPEP